VKRSGGLGESGIAEGTSYRTLTGDLQAFFSGAGDYESVQILLRLDGITVHTAPGSYSVAIRYAIEAS